MLSRLPRVSNDPRLTDLTIGSDLMTRTNFRVHPSSEAGNIVSRNPPTQQRTQMLMQHQRHADDPRQGLGYSIGYNAPPPVHGQAPSELYSDPNNHYAYGPGSQPSYHRGYFPPQPLLYQPIFRHDGPPPPHMMNGPYYGSPLQGLPPQYHPPPQHPQHQSVEVKCEGPPNPQYYGGYNPYPQNSSHQNAQAPMDYSGRYPPRGPPQPTLMSNPRPYEPSYQNNQNERPVVKLSNRGGEVINTRRQPFLNIYVYNRR